MANYSQSGDTDFAVQIAPGISHSGPFDTQIKQLVSQNEAFGLTLEFLKGIMRTKQVIGFDLTESALSGADVGSNTGGSWSTTWKRSRINAGGTSYWQITLAQGTYLIIMSIAGTISTSGSTTTRVFYVGLSTDASADNNTGIVGNSVMQIPTLSGIVSPTHDFGLTHAYIQSVSAGGQTFTVKRAISDITNIADSVTEFSIGTTVDGLALDGSVIRAYQIGQ